jgi:hypothetical protein
MLINTLKELSCFGVNVELIIMDAGYCSKQKLEQLTKHNIPFLTRMTKNRNEYKDLIRDHSGDLRSAKYLVRYNKRKFCGKKVAINLYNSRLYAYIMLDLAESAIDIDKSIDIYCDDPDSEKKIDEHFFSGGKFILLSSKDYDIQEILPLYYTRQEIEQIFDTAKTYAGALPIRGHSEETIKGILLVSFIATTVYSCLGRALEGSRYSANSALRLLNTSYIKMYKNITLLDELTKQHEDIFLATKIDVPFSLLEKGSLYEKKPLEMSSGRKYGHRGRPKGSKNRPKHVFVGFEAGQEIGERRPRGRPKGSKNKATLANGPAMNPNHGERRPRGRPKGSKNKAKRPEP